MLLAEFLRSRSVGFVTLLHRPVHSAARFAHSVHVPGVQVAKSVLVAGERGLALAVLPATCRVDLARLAGCLREREVSIAGEGELERVFHDCELGAVPPFGSLYGVTTVVELRLAAHSEIVVAGNTRHEGLRLRYRDYERIEQPLRARFGVAIDARAAHAARHAG